MFPKPPDQEPITGPDKPPKVTPKAKAEPKPKVTRESPELKRVLAEMKAIKLPNKAENPDEYSYQYGRLTALALERDRLVAESAPPPIADAPRTIKDVEADMKAISKTLPDLKQNDPDGYTAQYSRLLALAKERDELKAQA